MSQFQAKREEEARSSFFEKKEAKKLYSSGCGLPRMARTQTRKSFLVLFFKKELLPQTAGCS
jgi:hypothetical protein